MTRRHVLPAVLAVLLSAPRALPLDMDPPAGSIHRAVLGEHTDEIHRILQRDMTRLNARDADGMTPLHLAICRNRPRAFDLLVAAGADVRQATGETMLRVDRDGGVVVFVGQRRDWTPLHLAAFGNRLAMARVLLEKGAPLNARNDWGETPLYLAAAEGNLSVMRYLMSLGADVNVTARPRGWSALRTAVFNGHLETARMLHANRAAADLCAAAGLGLTAEVENAISKDSAALKRRVPALDAPLYWAALRGQWSVAQLLLSRGAPHDVRDEKGRTPALVAAMNGHSAVLTYLLNAGADINDYDDHGQTALHLAAGSGSSGVVSLLLSRKARTDIRDVKGRTALDVSREAGRLAIAEQLGEHESKPADVAPLKAVSAKRR